MRGVVAFVLLTQKGATMRVTSADLGSTEPAHRPLVRATGLI